MAVAEAHSIQPAVSSLAPDMKSYMYVKLSAEHSAVSHYYLFFFSAIQANYIWHLVPLYHVLSHPAICNTPHAPKGSSCYSFLFWRANKSIPTQTEGFDATCCLTSNEGSSTIQVGVAGCRPARVIRASYTNSRCTKEETNGHFFSTKFICQEKKKKRKTKKKGMKDLKGEDS